jgi:hypothetical protein
MSSTDSTHKIILALLAIAGLLLLGPYIGISPFGRSTSDSQFSSSTNDADEQPIQPKARSVYKPADMELDLPSSGSSETRKPSVEPAKKDSSDLEDLLKSR